MAYRFLITAQTEVDEQAKETLTIENDIQIFDNCVNRSRQTGERNLTIENDIQIF